MVQRIIAPPSPTKDGNILIPRIYDHVMLHGKDLTLRSGDYLYYPVGPRLCTQRKREAEESDTERWYPEKDSTGHCWF